MQQSGPGERERPLRSPLRDVRNVRAIRTQRFYLDLFEQPLPGNVDSIIIGTLYENKDNEAVWNQQRATGVWCIITRRFSPAF